MKSSFLLLCFALPLLCFGNHSYELPDEKADAMNSVISLFYEESSESFVKQTEEVMPKLMELTEISPFELLGFILKNDELKMKMSQGLRDEAKGALFMQGFGFHMTQEIQKEGFDKDLAQFCDDFHLKLPVMKNFVLKSDWSRFVLYSFKGSLLR